MTNEERLQEKRGIWIMITIVLAVFIFFIIKCDGNSSSNSSGTENTSYENSNTVDEQSSEYSGNYCAECGIQCKTSREIYSSGDIVSNNKPYYVCGDMKCVESRYQRDLQEQSSSSSRYSAGRDGRVYDNEPCPLCEGTGIEKNHGSMSNEYGRICPMCDGRGHQSY